MTTRAEFLGRVRAEVARSSGRFAASTAPRPAHPREAAELVRREMTERWPAALEKFREEFERVAGVFHRVASAAEVPGVIGAIAAERGAREIVTWEPAALALDLRPSLGAAGLAVMVAPPGGGDEPRRRHRDEAARAGLGVTGADLALAETGTLILVSGAGRPRSTSLLPETHVAVFGPDRLVESLEQVGIMLEALHVEPAQSMSGAMINFITGPSRTADIELTLTRGVHGPKHVHAVFVDGGLGDARMSSPRYFTPAEVDALIPKLSGLVEAMMEHHREASELAAALRDEQERIQASGGGLIDQRDWKARAERLDGLGIEVRVTVEAIGELGGAVKDLAMGLVDFPGRVHGVKGGEPVNLCWKHGETGVRFWHGFDEGYGQRKPLP